ncbi:MAG: BTAD domain-containing putative transcriptional regulator [Chloroflexota bacterium]
MAKLVTLFGLLRIEENGKLSAVMKNQKGCALLIYLLLTQKRHSREALADLLWEAKTTEDSLRNLRQLLSRVRKRLPELEITRDWIGLKEDAELNVDLYKLEAGLVGEDLNQQAAALQLYTGELLSGFYLSDATHFAEWLIIEQERLHRRVLGHFPVLCQALLAARAWQKGVEVARHWLTVDDLDEEGHRYLMRFLAAAGQTAAALAQYQSLCQLYEEELGVEPAEQTTALYEKLATEAHHFEQETAVIPHTPRQNKWGEAPNPIAFYGREAELAQLTEWLVPQQARLVTILGIGGQGKTALAAMTARSLADQFEGVYWRSLINAPPLHIILPDIISFFSHNQKLPPENLAEQLEMVRRLIEHNRFLLVLDNVETILDGKIAGKFRPSYADYEQLLQLFGQGGHQSCLLLTSREAPSALNRLAQQSARVKTLQLSGLGESASSDLFAAGQIEASDETVLTLAKRYSGNPLALKLVTQTIQDFYFGEAAAFLDEETLIFDDIRDVLDQQFQRLSLLEQSILIWLAIIRVATPPQMLAKLLNEPVRQRELLEAMKRLQRRSLLERENKGFGLQIVVTEYLTDNIVETVSF